MDTKNFTRLISLASFLPKHKPGQTDIKYKSEGIYSKNNQTPLFYTPANTTMNQALREQNLTKPEYFSLEANGISLTDLPTFTNVIKFCESMERAHVNRACLQNGLGYIPFVAQNDEARLVLKTIYPIISHITPIDTQINIMKSVAEELTKPEVRNDFIKRINTTDKYTKLLSVLINNAVCYIVPNTLGMIFLNDENADMKCEKKIKDIFIPKVLNPIIPKLTLRVNALKNLLKPSTKSTPTTTTTTITATTTASTKYYKAADLYDETYLDNHVEDDDLNKSLFDEPPTFEPVSGSEDDHAQTLDSDDEAEISYEYFQTINLTHEPPMHQSHDNSLQRQPDKVPKFSLYAKNTTNTQSNKFTNNDNNQNITQQRTAILMEPTHIGINNTNNNNIHPTQHTPYFTNDPNIHQISLKELCEAVEIDYSTYDRPTIIDHLYTVVKSNSNVNFCEFFLDIYSLETQRKHLFVLAEEELGLESKVTFVAVVKKDLDKKCMAALSSYFNNDTSFDIIDKLTDHFDSTIMTKLNELRNKNLGKRKRVDLINEDEKFDFMIVKELQRLKSSSQTTIESPISVYYSPCEYQNKIIPIAHNTARAAIGKKKMAHHFKERSDNIAKNNFIGQGCKNFATVWEDDLDTGKRFLSNTCTREENIARKEYEKRIETERAKIGKLPEKNFIKKIICTRYYNQLCQEAYTKLLLELNDELENKAQYHDYKKEKIVKKDLLDNIITNPGSIQATREGNKVYIGSTRLRNMSKPSKKTRDRSNSIQTKVIFDSPIVKQHPKKKPKSAPKSVKSFSPSHFSHTPLTVKDHNSTRKSTVTQWSSQHAKDFGNVIPNKQPSAKRPPYQSTHSPQQKKLIQRTTTAAAAAAAIILPREKNSTRRIPATGKKQSLQQQTHQIQQNNHFPQRFSTNPPNKKMTTTLINNKSSSPTTTTTTTTTNNNKNTQYKY